MVDRLSVVGSALRTAFSTAQATQPVTLLKLLGTVPTLTAAQASNILARIERLLTPTRRTALKEAASQMAADTNPFLSERSAQVLNGLLAAFQR